ncbi:type II secretion system F family protein [Nocardioides sp. R-C-SC26]|uniref:type II secretion system F family protein n=1 Tax=Nocardioides sp. R-C-SC26 TaxID=2870414 RepID=UPI001E31DA6F|nr:type II secretion system F family protein [Nocardioides sp. R-C-SC26]
MTAAVATAVDGVTPGLLVASAAVAGAVVLLLPAAARGVETDAVSPAAPGGAPSPRSVTSSVSPRAVLAATVAVVLVVIALAGPARGVAVGCGAGAVWVGLHLWRRRLADRAAQATSARVVEMCEALAADLASGRPPGDALDDAAEAWAQLAPVAEAQRVGADVGSAWRRAEATPGADGLAVVAAAWQVSHRTGGGLDVALTAVARELRAAESTQRVVVGELASARATARLMAMLPLGALMLGTASGADPWGFLLGHPVGVGCLALGLTFAGLGVWWIEALARGATSR